jgi:hypothetical protein
MIKLYKVIVTQIERGYVVTSKNGWLCICYVFGYFKKWVAMYLINDKIIQGDRNSNRKGLCCYFKKWVAMYLLATKGIIAFCR